MRHVPATSTSVSSDQQILQTSARVSGEQAGASDGSRGAHEQHGRASSIILALLKVTEYFFYTILLALPLDVYLTPVGGGSGVFLSQVLTVEACFLLVITLLFARWMRVHLPTRLTWQDAIPLIAILLASEASAIGSDFRSVAFKDLLKVAVYLGIYALARTLSFLPGIRKRAMLFLLIGFGVVAVFGLLGSLPGTPDVAGALLNIQRTVALLPYSTVARVSATFRYPNELAAYLTLILMLLLASAVTSHERVLQVCYALLFLVGFWVLVLSYTRGAWVAVLVVAPLLLVILGKKKAALIVALVGIGVFAVLVLRGGATSSRILTIFSANDRGYSTREAAWRWAISVFERRPIFGAGIGTIQFQPGAPYTNPAHHIKAVDAENLFLNVLAEMGIVGFIAVLGAFVGALRRAWKYVRLGGDQFDRAWNAGVLAGVVAILVYGMVDPVLVSGQVTGLIAALAGLLGLSSIAPADPRARVEDISAAQIVGLDVSAPAGAGTGFEIDSSKEPGVSRFTTDAIASGEPSPLPPADNPLALSSRMVFLLNSPGMGGAQSVSIDLADELQRHGNQVLIVCPPNSRALIERVEQYRLPYRALNMGMNASRWRGWLGTWLFYLPSGRRRFKRLIIDLSDEYPSTFVAPFLREQLLLAWLNKLSGVRSVWVLHSPLHYMPHRLFLRRLQRRLAHRVSAIIAVSKTQAVEWVQAGMPSSRLTIVRNGIPDKFFVDHPTPSHPLNGSVHRIGFISRVTEKKGAQFLVQALPGVLRQHPQTIVLIAGTGRYERRLRRLVGALGLRDHVQFLGFVADVPQLLQTLDLLALPTVDKGEVLPTILLEASAAGVPVIASDLPGISEAVLSGTTGILIPPGDRDALASAISHLLSNPQGASWMGTQGQAYVHSHYALSGVAAQFFDVLHDLESASRGPDGELFSTSQVVRVRLRSRFIRQTTLFLVSKVLSAAATAVWTLLAARALTQTAYGDLMLGVALLDIFAVVNDAGITTLATREAAQSSQTELPALAGSVILIKLALGVCSTLLIVGTSFLAPFSVETKFLLLLLAPGLIFSSMLSLSLLFRARAMLGQIVAVTCLVSIASVAVSAIVAVQGGDAASFALVRLCTAVASGFLMLILIAVQFRPRLWPDLRRIARMFASAIPYGVSLALIYLYYRIDVPILALLGGANQVAVYTSAYRILDVITLLPVAAAGVALAEMAKLAKEPDRKYLVQFSQQYLELALVIGLLIAVFLSVSGREILTLLFQGRYDDSYPALFVLGWVGAATLVTNVFLPLVNALGRRRVLIIAGLTGLVVNVATNLALIPSLGPVGAAIATLCTEIAVTACYAYVVIRELHWRLRWRVVLAAVLATGIGLGSQQICDNLGIPWWLTAAVSLSLWAAVLSILVPQWIRQLIQTRGNLRRSSGNTTPILELERDLARVDIRQLS